MAATAVPVSTMTATMQENVEYYPNAFYPVGSQLNPIAACLQALGVYASNLGRCGEFIVGSAGKQAVAFASAMEDADYHIEASAQDTDGIEVVVKIDWASRAAAGFDVYCDVVGATVHWATRKHTD